MYVTSCDPVAPHGFIVYAESSSLSDEGVVTVGSLQRIPIGATSAYQTTLVPNISNPVAVEFYHTDDLNGFIYWSDAAYNYIGRVGFDGNAPMRIINNVKTDSLAVDWVSGNIYWIDYQEFYNAKMDVLRIENFTISVSRLDGRYRKKLITSSLGFPRSIAVLPKQGYVTIVTVEVLMIYNSTVMEVTTIFVTA